MAVRFLTSCRVITLSLLLGLSTFAFAAEQSPVQFCEDILLKSNSDALVLATLPAEVRAALSKKGPFNQPMAVKIAGGKAVAYGTERAIESVKSSIGEHKEIVFQLGVAGHTFEYNIDGEVVRITTAPALCGSAVTSETFGDIDIESIINVQYDSFRETDLHRKDSVAAKALARFVGDYVRTIKSQHPYALTDFKAGEYDHIPNTESAQRTRSRAIKWTEDEIMAGEKVIETASGKKRTITLAEAMTSESRAKIDWAVDGKALGFVAAQTGIANRVLDSNVLFHISGQRGNNTPVLRIAHEKHVPEVGATGGHIGIEGTSGFSPLRLTTVYFDPKHVELARQVSVTSPPLNIFYTNAHLLDVTRTYRSLGQYYKVLRRISRRLNYWSDVSVFNEATNNSLNPATLQSEIDMITQSGPVALLHQLRVMLDPILVLREHGFPVLAKETEFMQGAKAYLSKNYPDVKIPETIADMGKLFDELIEAHVQEELKKRPYISQYIDFVLDPKHSYKLETIGTDPFFITYRPGSKFAQSAARLIKRLKAKYPKISFSNPKDLHMTIAYVGKVTPDVEVSVRKVFAKYSAQLAQIPFELSDGALQIIGSNNSQLGVVFKVADMPPEVLKLIQKMKLELVEAGLKPDKHLDEFLPHISIAHLRDAYFSPEGHQQLHGILANESLPPGMTSVTVSGKADLLIVNEPATQQPTDARYRKAEDQPYDNSLDIDLKDLDE